MTTDLITTDTKNPTICGAYLGFFPFTVTVTTRVNRDYKGPLIRPPLRTVTGWGNNPKYMLGARWVPPSISISVSV